MNTFQNLVRTEIEKLQKAVLVLTYSYHRIIKHEQVSILSDDELVEVEAFTARFSRLADIFLQSSLKTIDEADLENEGSVRDRINRAEKKGVIKSANTQMAIRYLRNKMAHDYVFESLQAVFDKAKHFTPLLIEDVENGIRHLEKYLDEENRQ